jgi:hypothetical protein
MLDFRFRKDWCLALRSRKKSDGVPSWYPKGAFINSSLWFGGRCAAVYVAVQLD